MIARPAVSIARTLGRTGGRGRSPLRGRGPRTLAPTRRAHAPVLAPLPAFPRSFALALVAALAAAAVHPPAAADGGVRLFRPLVADPREDQSRWRMVSFTEDWRFGT